MRNCIKHALRLGVLVITALCVSLMSTGVSRVSAADTTFLTKAEVRALYGDTIPFTYLSGSTGLVENGTFTLQGVNSTYRIQGALNADGVPTFTNWEYLLYSSAWGIDVSLNASEVTVQLNPQYSIIDTETFTGFVALSTDYDISSAVYDASVWQCRSSISGDVLGYSPAVSGMYSVAGFRGSGAVDKYVVCPVNYSSQSSGAFSSIECRFRGCGVSTQSGMNQRLYLLIGFPRVTSGASASSGTVPTTTEQETTASSSGGGGGDVNVTVIVNNSEIVEEQSKMNSLLVGDDAETETTLQAVTVDLNGSAMVSNTVELIQKAGIWTKLIGSFLGLIPMFTKYVPAFLLLAVLAFMIWRK